MFVLVFLRKFLLEPILSFSSNENVVRFFFISSFDLNKGKPNLLFRKFNLFFIESNFKVLLSSPIPSSSSFFLSFFELSSIVSEFFF